MTGRSPRPDIPARQAWRKKKGPSKDDPTPSTGTRHTDESPSPSNETCRLQPGGSRLAAARADYSNSMMISSTDRLLPALAVIFLTLQSCSALRMFSIFMASMTASFSLAFTS